jgi:hypothetical protein
VRRLKAPFPSIGGKSRAVDLVWPHLGPVRNYIEPFCRSAAMLLGRPTLAGVETLNDLDPFIANFWRAVQADPERVAGYADWPVSEVDMHARHRWLMGIEWPEPFVPERCCRTGLLREAYLAGFRFDHPTYHSAWRARMLTDPDYYDAKIAGWWVWGACCYIGAGWCSEEALTTSGDVKKALVNCGSRGGRGMVGKRPNIGDHSSGLGVCQQSPDLSGESGATGRGVHASAGPFGKRPALSGLGPGKGVTGLGVHAGRVQLADERSRGRGVHANDDAGTCAERRAWLVSWMRALADRLRSARVCCGDWLRVCNSPSTTTRIGLTGLFLDPPYPRHTESGGRDGNLYSTDLEGEKPPEQLRDEVLAYCHEHGPDPLMRIAVCGYAGDGYEALESVGWSVLAWKSNGGYGNRGKGDKRNRDRERIWFSPHCLRAGLFE